MWGGRMWGGGCGVGVSVQGISGWGGSWVCGVCVGVGTIWRGWDGAVPVRVASHLTLSFNPVATHLITLPAPPCPCPCPCPALPCPAPPRLALPPPRLLPPPPPAAPQMRQAVKSKKAALLGLLRTQLPDFSLQIKWELGSGMPGVRQGGGRGGGGVGEGVGLRVRAWVRVRGTGWMAGAGPPAVPLCLGTALLLLNEAWMYRCRWGRWCGGTPHTTPTPCGRR